MLLMPIISLYSENQNILNAKNLTRLVYEHIAENFLGKNRDFSVYSSEYFHDDFFFLPGDEFHSGIIGQNINIEDAYIIYDDINLSETTDEPIIIVTFSYYLAGYITEEPYTNFIYKEFDRISLNKYYFSTENNQLKLLHTGFQWPIFSFVDSAKKWIENNEYVPDELISDLDQIVFANELGKFNLYNCEILKYRKPNDYWITKAQKYYNKSISYKEENDIGNSINYLKEAVYAYPNPNYYYELGNLLFETERYVESMNSFRVSAELDYTRIDFAYYNAACAASKAMIKDKGYLYLEAALQAGYSYWDHLQKDNDIDFLRRYDEFEDLLNSYK